MNVFTVYTKPSCPFCDQAKALLESKGLQFDIVNIDVGQQKEPNEKYITRDELIARVPGARTVPQIFMGETLVGGFQDLKKSLSAT